MFGVPVRMFPRNPLPAVALDGHSIDLRAFHYATSCKQKQLSFFICCGWKNLPVFAILHSVAKISCAGCLGLSPTISAQFTFEMCIASRNREKFIKTPYTSPSGNILRDKLVLVEFLILLNFKYYLRISPQDNEGCHLKFGLCVCALSQRHGSVFFNLEIRLRNSLLPPSASFLA